MHVAPLRAQEIGDGVSSNIPFINGGGGSIFSRAALQQMNTEKCLNFSMPGQRWWRWQSDWMIGACANDAGIAPTPGLLPGRKGYRGHGEAAGIFTGRSETRFNQFACTEEGIQLGCDGVQVAEYPWPATLHPVRRGAAMQNLYQYFANATWKGVPLVRMHRLAPKSWRHDSIAKLSTTSFFGFRVADPPTCVPM